jgi:membrane fusion protein (multidrug efflux system)
MRSKTNLIMILTLFTLTIFLFQCGNSNAGEKAENGDTADSTAVNSDSTNGDQANKEDEQKDEDLIPVEVTTIKMGSISDYILISANLETEKMADVYSRVQGIVEAIYSEEGQAVQQNKVLLKLEAEEYELAAERARLNYDKQNADFNRLKAMYEQNLISKEQFDQADFTTKTLKIEWQQANLNLSYTRIKAPIQGVIGERLCKPGDRIQPSDKLYSVINTDEMIAVVYVPEKELGHVRKGQAAYITSDHIRGEHFTGSIKRVSPVVDAQSGTFKVTIAVNNKKNMLKAGMFINSHIITETHDDAILVPKTAIIYENELMSVFVVKDSVAHKVVLEAGFQDHEKVEVKAGIEAGDKVIVIGQAGLKDQTRVKIVSERENTFALRRSDSIFKGI